MKRLVMLAALAALLLTAGSALAEREVVVTRLADQPTTVRPDFGTQEANPACMVGNLNAAAYSITNWVYGAEKYKYLFTADPASCTSCVEGFTVTSVNLQLNFTLEDVPSTFQARVDFEEAVWDEALGCFVPGAAICVSPDYTITIDVAGLYNISLPLSTACACAEFGYTYGIGFEFITSFPDTARPDLVTDQTPVGCTSYNDYGLGWEDLYSFGFPGEIIMNAEIVCCDNPVPVEKSTWGEIKSMFR
jgi:hypothetical protein